MNYWIFKGNPDAYDFQNAIAKNILNEWNVKQHSKSIQRNDKAIIWLTGKNAGCYALADIISDPESLGILEDHNEWRVDNDLGRKHYSEDATVPKVKIDITHNLFIQPHKPLLWKDLKTIKGLDKLKVRARGGTNFAATKEEYELLFSLIDALKK